MTTTKDLQVCGLVVLNKVLQKLKFFELKHYDLQEWLPEDVVDAVLEAQGGGGSRFEGGHAERARSALSQGSQRSRGLVKDSLRPALV
jgi:hypothetical protein